MAELTAVQKKMSLQLRNGMMEQEDFCLMVQYAFRAQLHIPYHIQLTFTAAVHGQLSIFYISCLMFQ